MASVDIDTLAKLLEQSGVGWLLSEDRIGRLKQIAGEIGEVSKCAAVRFGRNDIDLLREMQTETESLKPLIQLFASPTSTEMRTMAYGVLRGMDIREIGFSYRLKSSLSLHVTLGHAGGDAEVAFHSTVPWDADILRHLGIMTVESKPVLHGFYAFR